MFYSGIPFIQNRSNMVLDQIWYHNFGAKLGIFYQLKGVKKYLTCESYFVSKEKIYLKSKNSHV